MIADIARVILTNIISTIQTASTAISYRLTILLRISIVWKIIILMRDLFS